MIQRVTVVQTACHKCVHQCFLGIQCQWTSWKKFNWPVDDSWPMYSTCWVRSTRNDLNYSRASVSILRATRIRSWRIVWLTVYIECRTYNTSRRPSIVWSFLRLSNGGCLRQLKVRFLSHDNIDMLIAFEASDCWPVYIGRLNVLFRHHSPSDLRNEHQVRHRPIVFQLRGVEERLLQQRCDDSMALRNRQLTTKQRCFAPYGKNWQQYIDGLLKNWRRHWVKWTRLLWEAMMIRQTSFAETFRNPIKDASAETDSSGLAFPPQCLLER